MRIYYFETWELIIKYNLRQTQPHDFRPSERDHTTASERIPMRAHPCSEDTVREVMNICVSLQRKDYLAALLKCQLEKPKTARSCSSSKIPCHDLSASKRSCCLADWYTKIGEVFYKRLRTMLINCLLDRKMGNAILNRKNQSDVFL